MGQGAIEHLFIDDSSDDEGVGVGAQDMVMLAEGYGMGLDEGIQEFGECDLVRSYFLDKGLAKDNGEAPGGVAVEERAELAADLAYEGAHEAAAEDVDYPILKAGASQPGGIVAVPGGVAIDARAGLVADLADGGALEAAAVVIDAGAAQLGSIASAPRGFTTNPVELGRKPR